MFERLPNKKTSKNALYFLTIAVLTFLLVFGALAYETQAKVGYTDIVVKADTGQVYASDSVSSVEIQIRNLAEQENFQWADYLVRLANCESTLNVYAINAIGNSAGIDRGLFQINSYYHGEVPDDCAYDLECSTLWTMERIETGYQHEWTCDRII